MRDHETNERHAKNPKPGDYWHEMYAPIMVVLEVRPDTIVFCRQQTEVDATHWRWNLGLTERLAPETFYEFLHYESKAMKDKCWCDVVPKGNMLDLQAYLDMQAP